MKLTENRHEGIRLTIVCVSCLLVSLAIAADYHWTGAAGNRLWSDPGNWETSAGAAVESVDCANPHTYNFGTRSGVNVGWENGLVVTQDVNVVIGAALALNPANGNFIKLEIVSAPGCKMSMAGDEEAETAIYCQQSSQLKLTVDMSGDNNDGIIHKHTGGRLVWNLKEANKAVRVLNIAGGTVVLGGQNATGVSPNLRVSIGTSASQTTARFENELNGGTIHALFVGTLGSGSSNLGRVYLKGNGLDVGGGSDSTSTNQMPFAIFGEGGTLTLRNERRASLRGLPMGGTFAVDRADARIGTPNTAIRWLFDDASDPTRDVVGSGSRMIAPKGMPDVALDATRGSVLSISDGKYLKGPDADAGLDGLLLQSSYNPYTVAFWFKPDANCDNLGKIFYWGGNQENGKSAALRLNNDAANGLMFTVWGANKTLSTPASPRDGNWHHFAAVYDGLGHFTIYYDGTQVLGFNYTAADYNPPNKNFYIGSVYGGWTTNGQNPYTGLLDDFLIGSYALSAEEIAALKNNGLAAAIPAPSVEARSAGEVAFAKSDVCVKTLSGNALAGGVTMLADSSTLTVGAESGEAATTFMGKIAGGGTTLVKEGTNYALTLSGPAAAVTNVVVKEGTLAVKRPLARAGLVAYYGFDDANAFGEDSSPAGFNLTKTGSGTVSQIADGVSGKALNFGGSAYLGSGVCTAANTTFPKGSESYTVSVWIRPTAEACSGTVPICCWGDNNTRLLSMIRFGSAREIIFTNWGAENDASASDITIADGNWHHVVATYDGSVKRLYFDGVLKGQSAVALDVKTNHELQIGHCSVPSRADQYYTGGMDEFMVFDSAWSAEDVSKEYARKAPVPVAAETLLPAPVAHWTFDDDAAPGADSSANALNLTMSGTVSLESGDAICGKAARFSSSSGWFKRDTFPAQIPSGSAPFTVVVRYRPDTTQTTSYYPGIVMWGDTSGWNSGKLLKISVDHGRINAIRSTINGEVPVGKGTYMNDMGTDRSRWITAAYVSAPQYDGTDRRTAILYVDGERMWAKANTTSAIAAQDFSIGSNYAGVQNFYGLIDDVQIYDRALSAAQIRLVTEQMEATKGGATASAASVLAANPDVTVADSATLKVASVESAASLSGAGTVEIAPLASLTVESLRGFSGSLTGSGTMTVLKGSTLDRRRVYIAGTLNLQVLGCGMTIIVR